MDNADLINVLIGVIGVLGVVIADLFRRLMLSQKGRLQDLQGALKEVRERLLKRRREDV